MVKHWLVRFLQAEKNCYTVGNFIGGDTENKTGSQFADIKYLAREIFLEF